MAHGLRLAADYLGVRRTCAPLLLLVLGLLWPATAHAVDPPANDTRPQLAGTARDGQVLSSTTGVWSGAGPITYRRQWRRCDAVGESCQAFAATAATYTLAGADVGSTLRVRVEATGPGGVSYADSDPSGVVGANPPNHTVAPVVSGAPRVGQTLTATQGTWTGSQPIAYERRWRRCDAAGEVCADVPGATGAQRVLTQDDLGARLRHRVTGTNAAGADEGNSLLTAVVGAAQPPATTTQPSLSGLAMDRQTLSLDRGTWSGAGPLSFAQAWFRCNPLSGACQPIAGATGQTYVLASSDVGFELRAEVTATGPDGVVTESTARTGTVAPAPPTSTQPPTVGGAARVGQVLTAQAGTWTGTPTLAYAYEWHRCLDGSPCTRIPGATGTTRAVAEEDLGHRLLVRVTATNAAGSGVRESVPTAAVAPKALPAMTVAPAISGTPRDGQTLSSTTGTWTGTPTIAYARQWQRCSPACADIPGAVAAAYALTAADAGAEVRVRITATNPDGATATESAPVTVTSAPPSATTPPVLSGAMRDGELITATEGRWTGTPTLVFARRWEACRAEVCEPVPGATGTTLRLGSEQIGARVQLRVTATNAAGSVVAVSALGVPVEASPPAANPAPSLSGVATDGGVLTGDRGEWTGTVPIEYALQWRRCTSAGAQCVDVPGETALRYTLAPADVGRTLRLRVRATNARAGVTAESPASAVVQPLLPTATAVPVVTGRTDDGELLSATTGTWRGTPTLVHAYRWQRCPVAGCEDIAGATAATYRLASADVGVPVRVRVTAANAGGTAASVSAASAPVGAVAPGIVEPPAITGAPTDGTVLSATPGTWTGTAPQALTYAWRRCDAAGASCATIAGATDPTYALTSADVGATVRVRVTSANVAGTVGADSDRTPRIGAVAPVLRVAPAIAGEPRDASLLTVDTGEWTGTAPVAIAYRWQRCTVPSAGAPACVDVAGETGASLRLRTADVGRHMRVVVLASNAGGSASHTTVLTGEVLPSPPVNTVRPEVSGTLRDGEELTVSDGAWTGVVTFAYVYRWLRCDADGEDCGVVPGADRRTYRLSSTDTSFSIRAEVVARNPGGATAALSNHTTVAAPSPPSSLTAPTIGGHTGVGLELTAINGGWAGSVPMDFTRRWLRCGPGAGDPCDPIAGETRRTYRLTPGDLGHRIGLAVRASNAAGLVDAEATRSRVVRDDPPVNAAPPVVGIPALAAEGGRLIASEGDWGTNGPFEASFRWRRCDAAGNGCVDIAGASAREYDLVAADVGSTVRVTVTMDNGVGAAEATSAPIGPIRPAPPTNVAAPVVKAGGALLPGAELSTQTGTWRGAEPIAFGYEWLRCAPDGSGCEPIPGAGGAKYVLTAADVGRALRARVTATNPTAKAAAVSEPTGVVGALPPVSTGKVAVTFDGGSGKPRLGMRARGEGGTWTGTEPLRYGYRWQRCSSASDCQDIPGADGIELVLTADDVGRRIRFVVGAENAGGTASAASPVSEPVAGTAPAVARAPSVRLERGGRLEPGGQLVAEAGEWAGSGTLAFTYQWQRCKPGSPACKAIPGASGERLTLTAADVDQRLSVLVSARSPFGKGDAQSAQTETVAAIAPAAKAPPLLTRPPGTLEVGATLSASAGEWTGTGPLAYAYSWLRCTPAGEKCRTIAKAATATYALQAADFRGGRLAVGLRVAVTATNAAGNATQRSASLGGKGGAASGDAGDAAAGAAPKRPKPAGAAKATVSFKKGRLVVRVTCPKGTKACAGQATFRAKRLRRTVPFRLKAGKARRSVLKLTAAERRAVARARRVKGTLTVTGTAPAKPKRVTVRWRAR